MIINKSFSINIQGTIRMFDTFRRSVTTQIVLNCFVKTWFNDIENCTATDYSNIANDSWNYVADRLKLDDRTFITHCGNE